MAHLQQSNLNNPHHIITTLITSLSSPPNATTTTTTQNQNPLHQQSSPNNKNLLLTLHALFPNHLLPALDCLDRNLITRLILPSSSSSTSSTTGILYLVNSTHHNNNKNTNLKIIHLHPWTCTCPAFTFSAFPARPSSIPPSPSSTSHQQQQHPTGNEETSIASTSSFENLSLSPTKPICKHLLACALISNRPEIFGTSLEEREVSREEFAGWVAGWGD